MLVAEDKHFMNTSDGYRREFPKDNHLIYARWRRPKDIKTGTGLSQATVGNRDLFTLLGKRRYFQSDKPMAKVNYMIVIIGRTEVIFGVKSLEIGALILFHCSTGKA